MLIVLWLLKSLMYIMHLKITKKSNRNNHLTDLRTKMSINLEISIESIDCGMGNFETQEDMTN